MTAARPVDGGTCHVFHAFEAGLAVDLDRAAAAVRGARRTGLQSRDGQPMPADFAPQPVTFTVEADPVACGAVRSSGIAHVTVYDFGALSVRLDLPLAGSADALPTLARALVGNAAMLQAARDAAERALAMLGDAVERPALAGSTEDYVVFALPPVGGSATLRDGLPDQLLARILRAEEASLAHETVVDALSASVSWGDEDLAVVDWNGAVVVDRSPADALAILEFANAELVEMRWLDDRLDRALEEAFQAAAASMRGPRILAVKTARQSRRIAELQIDAAALYESVDNALKLFGDQWVARLHQAATRRLHIEDYERSVLRKIATLESVYGKVRDRQVQLRAELLEIVIILLIAFEVVRSLWP
jgi:hypothetical protein